MCVSIAIFGGVFICIYVCDSMCLFFLYISIHVLFLPLHDMCMYTCIYTYVACLALIMIYMVVIRVVLAYMESVEFRVSTRHMSRLAVVWCLCRYTYILFCPCKKIIYVYYMLCVFV